MDGLPSSRCREVSLPSPMLSDEGGFTLIEALAALAILALMLSALYPSLSAAGLSLSRVDARMGALQLASSLAEEQSVLRVLKPGVTRGRQGDYRWQITVANLPDEQAIEVSGGWRLYQVDVAVTWPPQRSVRLQSLQLAKPP